MCYQVRAVSANSRHYYQSSDFTIGLILIQEMRNIIQLGIKVYRLQVIQKISSYLNHMKFIIKHSCINRIKVKTCFFNVGRSLTTKVFLNVLE